MNIAIILASVRTGRNSERVGLYLKKFLEEQYPVTVEMLDLVAYNFPLFNERLKFQPSPSAQLLDFTDKIKKADGVLIVTPEYNGGYPASLKNVVDVLYEEWHRKPIAISTVSNGPFGGMQVITSLQYSLWKIRAWVAPAFFPNPKAQEAYDAAGNPVDKATADKRAKAFIDELMWCIEAKKRMA